MAYAIDYRGFDDDVLTFVFLSPIENPLFEAFRLLCKGGYVMSGCKVEHEHAWQWRNGKAYWRWVFTPIDYHPEMLSLDALRDFNIHEGVVFKGAEVRVDRGRKVPVGTVGVVSRIRDVHDRYGRPVATYADIVSEDGSRHSTSIENLVVLG